MSWLKMEKSDSQTRDVPIQAWHDLEEQKSKPDEFASTYPSSSTFEVVDSWWEEEASSGGEDVWED